MIIQVLPNVQKKKFFFLIAKGPSSDYMLPLVVMSLFSCLYSGKVPQSFVNFYTFDNFEDYEPVIL